MINPVESYDYSQAGACFVTIYTKDRECIFGKIVDKEMRLTMGGRIADKCWRNIPSHYPHVILDKFVVMPNHVYGVIFTGDEDVGVQNLEPLQMDGPREAKFQQIVPKSIGQPFADSKSV